MSAEAVRWNTHKRYLRDLARRGVATPPTVWLDAGTEVDVAATLSERGWRTLNPRRKGVLAGRRNAPTLAESR